MGRVESFQQFIADRARLFEIDDLRAKLQEIDSEITRLPSGYDDEWSDRATRVRVLELADERESTLHELRTRGVDC